MARNSFAYLLMLGAVMLLAVALFYSVLNEPITAVQGSDSWQQDTQYAQKGLDWTFTIWQSAPVAILLSAVVGIIVKTRMQTG